MAKNIISINDARIDTELFKGQNKQAQEMLRKIENLQLDFKDLVETVTDNTKLKTADVSSYFKARFAEKQNAAIAKGGLFGALNGILND